MIAHQLNIKIQNCGKSNCFVVNLFWCWFLRNSSMLYSRPFVLPMRLHFKLCQDIRPLDVKCSTMISFDITGHSLVTLLWKSVNKGDQTNKSAFFFFIWKRSQWTHACINQTYWQTCSSGSKEIQEIDCCLRSSENTFEVLQRGGR